MTVKTLNPFIPAVPLITVPNRSQRERFKTWFMAVLSAHLLLVLALLIRDYQREYEPASSPLAQQAVLTGTQAASDSSPADSHRDQDLSTKPASGAVSPSVGLQPQASAATASVAAPPESVYIVKSGDTLSQIARDCGTSVKALKAANGLNGERLAVGQKLNLKPVLYSKS